MMHFYTEESASKYYKKNFNERKYLYIMNKANIRIDGLNGEEFRKRQYEVLEKRRQVKMREKMQKKKEWQDKVGLLRNYGGFCRRD